MYNFQLVRYYNVKSDIHKFNPFYKLICLILFTMLVLITGQTIILILLFLFVMSLISMSKIPMNLYFKNLLFLTPFVLFILFINVIFNENILILINSILKLVLLVLYSSIIMYTTKPSDLTYGLEKLLKPLKLFNVPVSALAFSLSLSIRFIPIIFEQANRVLKAELSRGLNFNGTIKQKMQSLSNLIFPIFNLSLKRSDSISNTLDVRMYNPNKEVTKYKKYRNSDANNSIIFMHVLLLAIYIVLEAFL